MTENCGNPLQEELDEVAETTEEIEEKSSYIKMDYSLKTPEEVLAKVNEIIDSTPPEKLTPFYLEKLGSYIIDTTMNKEEKKQKKVLTDNHMVTVNKRETSFEGLVGKLENGEDGLYNMITEDKNVIFQPKVSITQEDIETIPGLKDLRDSIEKVEEEFSKARGKKAYLLKTQIIQLRQDQYVLKNTFKKPIYCTNLVRSLPKMEITDRITVDENGEVFNDSTINMFDKRHVSMVLCNYSNLKMDSWDKLSSDLKWFMEDFDITVDRALKDKHPMLYKLMIYKIDGKQNVEIQELLREEFNILHSIEYISSLWRNKIPKLISEQAVNDYLIWYYTFVEKGKWKRCSRCGEIKLVHNNFFSKNSSSKDGFYSICKACRNKKNKTS